MLKFESEIKIHVFLEQLGAVHYFIPKRCTRNIMGGGGLLRFEPGAAELEALLLPPRHVVMGSFSF